MAQTCVMVIYEGAGLLGPPAQQPWGPSVPVPQPVILCVLHCFLQDPLGGEVKGGGTCSGGTDPVTQHLPGGVLIVVQGVAKPPVHTGNLTASGRFLVSRCHWVVLMQISCDAEFVLEGPNSWCRSRFRPEAGGMH